MKEKHEILRALARTDEDKLLLAGALDKLETCRARGYQTATRFLDLRERALVAEAVRLAGASPECVMWGGYEEAERVCALFYPDYLTAEDAVGEGNAPIALLRAYKHEADSLTHRNYLGALMGLGIERTVTGDILVHDGGAEILVREDMAEFILLNFAKAGRKRLRLERVPLDTLVIPAIEESEGEGSVASLRLDSVTALIFGLPRSEAQQAIAAGLVFLNQQPCAKAEREVGAGDRITLRGKGRARVLDLGGVSRKGRQFVRFAKS